MINYVVPNLLFPYVRNMNEVNFDSFDTKFLVIALIIAVYRISWPKSSMVHRHNDKAGL